MDQHTEKGVRANEQSDLALQILNRLTGSYFYQTPNGKPSKLDGCIVSKGKLAGFFEIKSRDVSYDLFSGRYENEILLTYDKLWHAFSITKTLCLSFSVIYHLVPSKMILCKTVIDAEGMLLSPVRIIRSKTPSSVNGGEVFRNNAFIKMDDARVFRY